MRHYSAAKLQLGEWLALLPAIASLVGDVVAALHDGHVTPEEVNRIGQDLFDIVGTVIGRKPR